MVEHLSRAGEASNSADAPNDLRCAERRPAPESRS